jgi:hypothetical protein
MAALAFACRKSGSGISIVVFIVFTHIYNLPYLWEYTGNIITEEKKRSPFQRALHHLDLLPVYHGPELIPINRIYAALGWTL